MRTISLTAGAFLTALLTGCGQRASETPHPGSTAPLSGSKNTPGPLPVRQSTSPTKEIDDPAMRLIIQDILGTQSEVYLIDGYKGLNFGDGEEAVEAISPLTKRGVRSSFVKLQNGTSVYFSSEGRLVGISAVLSVNDLDRSVAMLQDTFGGAEKDHLSQTTSTKDMPGQAQRVHQIRATYHFPGSVVVATLTSTTTVFKNGRAQREGSVVTAFERSWVVEQLQQEVLRRREAFAWLAKLSDGSDGSSLKLEGQPTLRAATLELAKNPAREGVYWSERPENAARPRRPDQIGLFPNGNWVASCVLKYRQATKPGRSLDCEYRFNQEGEPAGNALFDTPLRHLVVRANAVLAQTILPPRGESIIYENGPIYEHYEWLTSDYRRVKIGTGFHGLGAIIIRTLDP